MPSSVHDITVNNAKGEAVNLGVYKGKVLIIVNVASECGLTNKNYTELKKLHDQFHQHGFEILAFPCNQFGGQEPGECEIIEEFVKDRFAFEPILFEKVEVNGRDQSELFKFLKGEKGGFMFDAIKWNFTKFLVDREGKVLKRFGPTTNPKDMEKDIKKALGI